MDDGLMGRHGSWRREIKEGVRRGEGGVVGRGGLRGPPVATMGLLLLLLRKRGRRGRVFVLLGLACCSPVLLPLVLLLSFPLFLCVLLALCVRTVSDACSTPACGGAVTAGCGAKRGEEEAAPPPLLQRYLEDQLGLVGSVVWGCCGHGDGGAGAGDGVGDGC